MFLESGDFLTKCQIVTILLLHLWCIQCISIWMRTNLNQSLLQLKLVQGLSKTCSECGRRTYLKSQRWMEHPMQILILKIFTRKRITVICVNCGGKHYRKTNGVIEIFNYLQKKLLMYLAIFVVKILCHVFSNFRRLRCVVYLAIFVV